MPFLDSSLKKLKKFQTSKALQSITKGAASFKENEEEAEDYTFDEKKILAVRQLLAYLLYLSVFILIVFLPNDIDQSYLMQSSIRKELLGTELSRDVLFEDMTSPGEWYQFMTDIFIPTVYRHNFYNGVRYPRNNAASYQPYFINDVNMLMGVTRIRQLRMPEEKTCSVTTFLEEEFETCHGEYSHSLEDTSTWVFGTQTLEYQTGTSLEDGDAWESPVTLTWYDSGGYVVDLPTSSTKAIKAINTLEENGFFDDKTRAIFVDFTAYNPNNDHVFFGRLVVESLSTGKIQPVAQLDAGPVNRDNRALTFQEGSSKRALAALFLEFGLYALAGYYISQWVKDISDYESFMDYLTVPWNFMDMGMVFCFAAILTFRATYMIRMASFQYDVKDELDETEWDWNSFVPLRVSVTMYRVTRNFFAMCILLAFLKAFKFLGVSKRMAQFTDTIFFAYKTMCILSIILGVITSGFAIAFHMSFGHALARYSSFTESLLSLLLSILGDFDLDELRRVNPVLGVILFITYIIIILFVTLSMLLKIVDECYNNVVEEFMSGSKENLGKDIKYAIFSVLHDIYWWFVLHRTLLQAKRLRHKADHVPEPRGSAQKYTDGLNEEHASLEAAALEKEQQVAQMKEEMERVKQHRKDVLSQSNYRQKPLTVHTISQMEEDEVTFPAMEDRIHLLQHRQAIMLKMATRLARSVEFRIGQQCGVQMRPEAVQEKDLPRPNKNL